MKLTAHASPFKTIKPDDDDFIMTDGVVVARRAGFEISQRCPKEYKSILMTCISTGWIIPVAVVRDSELMWDALST